MVKSLPENVTGLEANDGRTDGQNSVIIQNKTAAAAGEDVSVKVDTFSANFSPSPSVMEYDVSKRLSSFCFIDTLSPRIPFSVEPSTSSVCVTVPFPPKKYCCCQIMS